MNPYRPDIDGLRAVAILPVLFFHAGLPGFEGGFTGVDVFFVISGYLITQVISREMDEGQFSLLRFYERRVRRILPALIAMITVSMALSPFVMMPYDLWQFGRSVVAALSFSANFEFWQQSGYFGEPAQFLPLLHTWSLALEEQFYLAFPIILLAMMARPRRQTMMLLAVMFIASLALCIWLTRDHQGAAFYFSPSRAWELLFGCLIAFAPIRKIGKTGAEILALAGLLAIAFSVTMLSGISRAAFPGYVALLPCTGAGLLLYVHAQNTSLVKRALETRLPVSIGLISYSLYLWHWPLMAFAHIVNYGPISAWLTIIVVTASFAISVFSWRWIEQPFRKRNGVLARRKLFAAAGISTLLLTCLAFVAIASNGWPQRLTPQIAKIAEYENYPKTDPGKRLFGIPGCHSQLNNFDSYDPDKCFNPQSGEKNILLWGDSHAGHYAQVLAELLITHHAHLMQATKPACAPLVEGDDSQTRDCRAFNKMITERISHTAIDGVILSANWISSRDESAGRGTSRFDNLSSTVNLFRAQGVPVILVGQSPRYTTSVPTILARAIATNTDPDIKAQTLLVPHIFESDVQLKDKFGHLHGVTYISVVDALCRPGPCRVMATKDTPVYFDEHHLTYEGAEIVLRDALDRAVIGMLEKSR